MAALQPANTRRHARPLRTLSALAILVAGVSTITTGRALAQTAPPMPAEYAQVLRTLGRSGDFKDNVLKVNIPRSDLAVTIDGIAVPTPFGFGGWVALTHGDHGMDVMMGDLVLTDREVNRVMSAVLDNGLDVTALHNHFFFDTPRIFYMHVHGQGTPADLARRLAPALALIGSTGAPAPTPTGRPLAGPLATDALARIIGTAGEQNGAVYKITIGRPDLSLTDMGAPINARMGLNTWAAFYGSDAEAVVAGDVAMLAAEVTPVLKVMRANGLEIVAIHHHMTATSPDVYFLHYWGKGPAQVLATGVKAAVDLLGKTPAATRH